MQYALYEGERREAWPGARALCPACGKQTTAKCGEIVRWHWSHSPRRHCDPWWETETDWHRQWKRCFPQEWREVVQHDARTGERHIADVKTLSGRVLEFQNSPMPLDELVCREQFYGDMLWVVNASRFATDLRAMNRLPPPESELAAKLVVLQAPGHNPSLGWRQATIVTTDHQLPSADGAGYAAYNTLNVTRDGLSGGTVETQREIDRTFQGHQWLVWTRPHEAWMRATKPVVLDPGGDALLLIGRYSERIPLYCIGLSKSSFISVYGGVPPNRAMQPTGSARGCMANVSQRDIDRETRAK